LWLGTLHPALLVLAKRKELLGEQQPDNPALLQSIG
jgi:hypothetical protein